MRPLDGSKDEPMSDEDMAKSLEWMIEVAPHHCGVEGDLARRRDNETSGHALCRFCNGTGNRLASMYQRCPKCSGTGKAT